MRILVCLLTLLVTQVTGWGQQVATQSSDVELKKQAKSVIEATSPSIVTVAYGKSRFKQARRNFDCGVIVSPEGHIAFSGPLSAVIDEDLLRLRLANGQLVRGKVLGWSSEFGFGMLKITEEGPWPHVKVNDNPKVGEVSVALGYARNTKYALTAKPDVRLGLVTKYSQGLWLTTSHRSEFTAHPVFNLNGELLGLNTSSGSFGPVHASATLIAGHWDDLTAGKNLDRERLFAKEEMSDDALARAKTASVRISLIDDKESLASGTIVTADGYVITCGHHQRLPGETLRLSLPDGRSTTATVLGTDLISDVGVLKITEAGPWPHVEIGVSSTMGEGSACVLVGYPKVIEGRDPWVFRTQVIKPTRTAPKRDEWGHRFWTKKYPESIQGASGGGVFDGHGKIVGVLLGGGGQEMQHSRVELFRRNWDTLTANHRVQIVDTSVLEEASDSLSRIEGELSAESATGTSEPSE